MALWNRKKIGEVAKEIAEHASLVENVAALQQGQKEIADTIEQLGEKIRAIEMRMQALKAEVKFEAIKETQQMMNSVQGAFNDKLTDLTVRLSHLERPVSSPDAPLIAIGKKRPRRSPAKLK